MIEAAPSIETQKPYEVRDVTSLLVNSFRFSRGRSYLQREILGFVAYFYGHRLSSEVIKQARKPATKAVYQVLIREGLHPKKSEPGLRTLILVTGEVKDFDIVLQDKLENAEPCDLNGLAAGVIDADEYMLPVRYKTRPNLKDYVPTHPYKSNFLTHGLLGRSTGLAEYDEMYKQVYYRSLAINDGSAEPDDRLFRNLQDLPDITKEHIKGYPEDRQLLQDSPLATVLGLCAS